MLVDYSQIRAHFDAVKPIRGDVHNTKPFFGRRRKHEHMVMKDNGDIQIICYNTPVFTVHPDSSFSLCHGGYITVTTSKFISFVIKFMGWNRPDGLFYVYRHKNNLWLYQSDVHNKYVTFPIPKDPVRFVNNEPVRFVNNESLSVYEPEKVLLHTERRLRVDRDKSKQARAECKQFLTWLKAMVSVLDGNKLQYILPQTALAFNVRYLCKYPSEIKKLSFSIKLAEAAEELKNMLASDDDAKFLEVLHNVAGDMEFIKKKTVRTKVNRLIKYMYGAYYIDKVEIKTGSRNPGHCQAAVV